MSPREGINLLCTNRGLISPLRVCVCVRVRAGGAATASLMQVNVRASPLRACVRAGGPSRPPASKTQVSPLRACVRAGGVA